MPYPAATIKKYILKRSDYSMFQSTRKGALSIPFIHVVAIGISCELCSPPLRECWTQTRKLMHRSYCLKAWKNKTATANPLGYLIWCDEPSNFSTGSEGNLPVILRANFMPVKHVKIGKYIQPLFPLQIFPTPLPPPDISFLICGTQWHDIH